MVTAEDAVHYLIGTPTSTGLLIHCKFRHPMGMDYDPYDLLIVEQHEIDQDYFLISDRGVAHMRPREATDVTHHNQWLEEKRLFMLLKETKFFGKNTLVKVS